MCSLSAQLPEPPFFKRSPECRNDSSVTAFLLNRDLFYVPFSFIAYSSDVLLCQFLFVVQSNSSVIREWTLYLIVLIEKIAVEIDINNPNQRVFWSDLKITTKMFNLHHWQLQGD